MSLRSRLTALERRVTGADLQPSCPSCGGPNPGDTAVLLLEAGEERPGSCEHCGRQVDRDGRALSEFSVTIITLEPSEDDDEPPVETGPPPAAL